MVTNISPSTTGVAEGARPEGATPGGNGFGKLGPVGRGRRSATNRTVTSSGYAADKPLGLGEGATAEEVHAALDGHTLAQGTLVGLFGR